MSATVQALPSSQLTLLAVNTQAALVSQLSVVQGFPSLHTTAPPAAGAVQVPALHCSPLVQALASSQGSALAECWQPPLAAQVSVVHRLPSLQSRARPGRQAPTPQVSPTVQSLLSVQVAELARNTQAVLGLHWSSVQGLPSLHRRAWPGTQTPPAHWSFWLQALPSSQGALLLTLLQPPCASQVSVVQGLPSSQGLGWSGLQVPAVQVSPRVQSL